MANKEVKDKSGNMPLSGHLKELRNRLGIVVVAFIIASIVCFTYSAQLVEMLTDLGQDYGYAFVQIAPQETLLVYFNVSLIFGLVIILPLLAYEAYAFSSPGLKKKEKTFFSLALVFGFIFFVIGVLFAYKITMPFMLRFLISFANDSIITASISIQEYVNFVITIFIIFGAIFELPIISVILSALGILKAEWMAKARKVMIVVIFVIAAIITPPDVVSQIMVAVPMILLYELSILLCKLVTKFKKKDKVED